MLISEKKGAEPMSKQNKQSSFEKYYLSNLDINYIASDLDRIERQRKRNADRRLSNNSSVPTTPATPAQRLAGFLIGTAIITAFIVFLVNPRHLDHPGGGMVDHGGISAASILKCFFD